MVQEKIAALNALGPVEMGTIGVLVVSLLLALVLSVAIKRRAGRRLVPTQALTRAQIMAPQRPVGPGAPVDMKERLRRMTTGASASAAGVGDGASNPADAPVAAAARGNAAGPIAPPAVPPRTPEPYVAPSDDATRFFDEGVDGADGAAAAGADDATTFFAEPDPRHDHGDDATRFFADATAPDATTFFEAEPGEPDSAHGPSPAALPERDDATRFFGADDPGDAGAEDHDRTGFLPPSETRFFAPEDLEDDSADGRTGMLHALPPAANSASATGAAKGGMWDTAGEGPSPGGTGGLGGVRACLATVSAPEVMALSVIDGAGRVLAGETDEDLTGELRSLMAESGQGNTADIDQPVRLADDETGAILLLPTGANALLGALIRDADDPQETRRSLRAVAHNIGDAIRRAS